MESTPISLLDRLRQPAAGPDWDRFVLLYTPLLYLWVNRLGVAGPDADDVVQDVFVALVQALPAFQYDAAGRFRGWLWTVTRNKVRERTRRALVPTAACDLNALAGPQGDDPEGEIDEREYREYVTRRALELMRSDFEPASWRAFWATVVDGRTADDAAAELGITPNAVYLAKGRVLRRLREELTGLLD
jgi:RNA polymerase sigma-70 factor, ECF subfamily